MKKPSIYSDRYNKAKKKHRLRRNLWLFLASLALFLLFFLPYLDGKVKEFQAAGGKFPQTAQTTIPTGTKPATTPAQTAPPLTSVQTKPQPLTADHPLSDGSVIAIRYEKTEQGIRYLGAAGPAGSFSFDLSPDQSRLLINETSTQTLTLYGQDLAAEDHSFNTYRHSQKGQLKRTDYIQKDGFVWMRNARFLTNDLILFESQVALALKPFYVWSYDLKDKKFQLVSGTRAEDLELMERTQDGYRVRLDAVTKLVTPELKVE